MAEDTKQDRYTKDDNPSVPGTVVKRQEPALTIVRDVYAGTLRLQEKRDRYLPQWPKEDADAYIARVRASSLFNALKQTAKGLSGMVYLTDPEVGEDVPAQIRKDLEDIDLQGRDLASFGRESFEDAMVDGHAAIFVDMGSTAGIQLGSKADESSLGLRPYWVGIRKGDLLRPSVVRINGKMMLHRVAWFERTVEADGKFKDREVKRVRELQLNLKGGAPTVEWRLYTQKKEGDDTSWFVEASGQMKTQSGKPLSEIPVVATYTGFIGEFESEPPLLDLAIENLRHFRKSSDLDNIEHVTCVPILSLSGVGEDEFESVGVGPSMGLSFSDPNGKATWAEISGSGIGQVRESIKDIERRMAVQGLSMMMPETQQEQTATWKRIEKSESDSRLSVAARSHQVALNKALYFHAMWRGETLDESKAWITVNRDFESTEMPPEVMVAYIKAVSEADLPVRVLLEVWQQGGRIPADKDLDELEIQMMAAVKAAEDARAAEAQARAEAMQAGGVPPELVGA